MPKAEQHPTFHTESALYCIKTFSTLLGLLEWPGKFFCMLQLPRAGLSTHFLESSMWLLLSPLQCPMEKKCALKLLCYVNWHQSKILILLMNFMSFVLLNYKTDFEVFLCLVSSLFLWMKHWNLECRYLSGINLNSPFPTPPSIYNFLSVGAKLF